MRDEPQAVTTTGARPTLRSYRVVVGILLTTTLVSSVGWLLTAREGRGIPPECYSVEGAHEIEFGPLHGNATRRATFAVAESPTHVMLGYWEQVADGSHTAEGYASTLRYTLVRPLGDREVIDPAGEPIPACEAA